MLCPTTMALSCNRVSSGAGCVCHHCIWDGGGQARCAFRGASDDPQVGGGLLPGVRPCWQGRPVGALPALLQLLGHVPHPPDGRERWHQPQCEADPSVQPVAHGQLLREPHGLPQGAGTIPFLPCALVRALLWPKQHEWQPPPNCISASRTLRQPFAAPRSRYVEAGPWSQPTSLLLQQMRASCQWYNLSGAC